MTYPSILLEVIDEVACAAAKFGDQLDLPDDTGYAYLRENAEIAKRETDAAAANGTCSWRLVLREEVREALAESDPALLRAELIQVAAVAVRWIDAIDRRQS